jgi:sugar O-acyltransferase (sialic acid O-acetyltransferase NeuD family)
VSNILDIDNDSLQYPYKIKGVNYVEINAESFIPSDNDIYIIASVGKSRRKIYDYFREKFSLNKDKYSEVIHKTAVINADVKYGIGLHISPLSVIAPFTCLGDFVVINRNVSIGHHCEIGNFVTINPGVNIAGCCTIEENVIIGAGATIIDSIKIGKNTVIGAGSLVTKDIPEGVIAYGSPAKTIKDIA